MPVAISDTVGFIMGLVTGSTCSTCFIDYFGKISFGLLALVFFYFKLSNNLI